MKVLRNQEVPIWNSEGYWHLVLGKVLTALRKLKRGAQRNSSHESSSPTEKLSRYLEEQLYAQFRAKNEEMIAMITDSTTGFLDCLKVAETGWISTTIGGGL